MWIAGEITPAMSRSEAINIVYSDLSNTIYKNKITEVEIVRIRYPYLL